MCVTPVRVTSGLVVAKWYSISECKVVTSVEEKSQL